jgi:hypothetical protein
MLTIFLLPSNRAEAINAYDRGEYTSVEALKEAVSSADSIMNLVIANAIKYKDILINYDAEIYIKGRTQILDKNFLLRFAHNLFPVNRRDPDMVFEMINHTKFEAPNAFFHDYRAINGSSIPNRQKQREILSFLDLNIYASTAFDEAILMPTAKNAFRYYDFTIEDINDSTDTRIYRIGFMPKHLSQKLISGYMNIVDKVWTIAKIDLNGSYYFSDFNIVVTFGRDVDRFNLPETADLNLSYRMLGNSVVSNYHSRYNYTSIVRGWDELNKNTRQNEPLDLSRNYRAMPDTVPIVTDTLFWKEKRDMPLSHEESNLYAAKLKSIPTDTTDSTTTGSNKNYLSFAELLVNDMRTDYKNTYIRYYGILNPSQLGYSQSNGFSYRQRVRIQKRYDNQTQLTFIPDVGFVTKRKEFFIKGMGIWEYSPGRLGALTLQAGNSDQSYSSGMMKKINEQLADSAFDADDLNLQYFRHYYIELKNQIDLFNGFQLHASVTYNHRNPVKKQLNLNVSDELKELINSDYDDFTTTIGFSYTPRYYYRMNKRRKEYMYSHYPTFQLEFAKAIPGVFKSEGNYGRIEADVHQSISLGLLQKLNYHVSAGMYTSKKSSYFTDFRYFARRNFPDTWDDQIGGVFNLLPRQWFYASDQYAQVHFMYESPFILLRFFDRAASKYVFAERVYASQLWTPALPSYTEIGYGIGNHIFDIGLFAGFDKLNYKYIGVKFQFELFR